MIQPIQAKQLSPDGFVWNEYSQRVATISNELRHFRTVAYFQFSDWQSAHDFWKSITDKRLCTKAQVREAERFPAGWETKVWGMSPVVLEKLVERDRKRSLPLPQVRRAWSLSASQSVIAYEAA
jgi:tRNA(Leu) C34 or U34 (ribose-2'-O)-methylase TrmL